MSFLEDETKKYLQRKLWVGGINRSEKLRFIFFEEFFLTSPNEFI